MKTITKIMHSAFAIVIFAIGAVTANGAVNDVFASVNGSGSNGGGFIYHYTSTGVQSTFASGLSRPRGVAFDGFGNLFVATNTFNSSTGTLSAAILKIFPDGTQTTFANINGPSANVFAQDVKFDTAGNLFVMVEDSTDPNLASTIYKFTPNGTQSTFGSVPSQGFGLAFDSTGNLFATGGDQNIYKFTPDGTRTVFVGPTALAGEGPIGLAFDRFGNLFVSVVTGIIGGGPNDGILKFTPNGVGSTFATGLLKFPRGLAFNQGGNLFVAEVGEDPNPVPAPGDILKFTPNGVETVFAQNIVPGGNNSGPEYLAVQLPTTPPHPTPPPH